jgi:lauroyl/myristoyl acyltransferase
LERQSPGAEQRWHHLVEALHDLGAVSLQVPRRTSWWWVRTVSSVVLGSLLSLLSGILTVLPIRILLGLCERLPTTPLSTRTLDHLLPFIEANLRAAGYVDQPLAWRRKVARQVTAATVRTHFMTYLMLVLPPEKVCRLVEHMTALRGMDHVLQARKEHDGAIVVLLHWELYLAPAIRLGQAYPVTMLADLDMADYSVGSDREPPTSTIINFVNSTSRMAAKTLLHRLRAGQIVMLFFDVAPSGVQGAAPRRIRFLDHTVTRFDTTAWLATHSEKPIIFASIYRERSQLIVDFSAPLLPAPSLLPDERIAHLTAQVYETAEHLVCLHPEAWLTWSYLHTLAVPAP